MNKTGIYMKILIIKNNDIKYNIKYNKERKVFIINNINVKYYLFYDFINNYLIYILKTFKYVRFKFFIYKRKILFEKVKNKKIEIVLHNYINMLTSN